MTLFLLNFNSKKVNNKYFDIIYISNCFAFLWLVVLLVVILEYNSVVVVVFIVAKGLKNASYCSVAA